MKTSLTGLAFFLISVAAFAACPNGQMPGLDAYGNKACISAETREVVALEAVQDSHCSPGYERRLDTQGRWECRDSRTGVTANPRLAKCPPGTWLVTDAWGYERCKPVP